MGLNFPNQRLTGSMAVYAHIQPLDTGTTRNVEHSLPFSVPATASVAQVGAAADAGWSRSAVCGVQRTEGWVEVLYKVQYSYSDALPALSCSARCPLPTRVVTLWNRSHSPATAFFPLLVSLYYVVP